MRREDQEKINRFSRLHQRELNLEEEMRVKNKEKEELDDITMELELVDEDDKVPYVCPTPPPPCCSSSLSVFSHANSAAGTKSATPSSR